MIFEMEQILYAQEGLRLTTTFSPKYLENSNQIDFFENPVTGLFAILNEHTKQSDAQAEKKFLMSLIRKNETNPCFEATESLVAQNQFIIHHYTIPVVYQVENILERNKGIREINFTTLSSNNQRLYSTDNSQHHLSTTSPDVILPTLQSSSSLTSAGGSGTTTPTSTKSIQTTIRSKSKTICSVYFSEVCDLIVKLQGTKSHFIICLKPNHERSATLCDLPLMKQQIQSYSILETCLVTSNFISRQLSFPIFFHKYRVLLYPLGLCSWTKSIFQFLNGLQTEELTSSPSSPSSPSPSSSRSSYRETVLSFIDLIPVTQLILNQLYPPTSEGDDSQRNDLQIFSNNLKVGHTNIFLLSNIYDLLERLYYLTTDLIARKLQRIWKLHRTQKTVAAQTQRVVMRSMRYFNHFRFLKVRDTTIAAIQIQRKYRQHLQRRRYLCEVRLSTQLPLPPPPPPHDDSLDRSLIKCQSLARGWLCRKDLKKQVREISSSSSSSSHKLVVLCSPRNHKHGIFLKDLVHEIL
jgi:myosin heavy subunit